MMVLSKSMKPDGGSAELAQKLMVSGFVCPENGCALSLEVRRGMPIFSEEGLEVGKVAAVVLNQVNQQVTHILLSRLPETNGYWLIRVDLVVDVRDEKVQLSMPEAAIGSLPRWHSR